MAVSKPIFCIRRNIIIISCPRGQSGNVGAYGDIARAVTSGYPRSNFNFSKKSLVAVSKIIKTIFSSFRIDCAVKGGEVEVMLVTELVVAVGLAEEELELEDSNGLKVNVPVRIFQFQFFLR